jgi:hypothetical protein
MVLLLGLLVVRPLAKDDICVGTIRVVLLAPPQDYAVARSPGRHDTLAQLTAEHGNEPRDGPSGWLRSREVCTPPRGLTRGTQLRIRTRTARYTNRERRKRPSTFWLGWNGVSFEGRNHGLVGSAGERYSLSCRTVPAGSDSSPIAVAGLVHRTAFFVPAQVAGGVLSP